MPEFERHFSVREANELLPRLRVWLVRLQAAEQALEASHQANQHLLQQCERDVGGPELAAHYLAWERWLRVYERIQKAGAQLKDLERGLVDFPHLLPETGEEVFLCWELSEAEVAHWHPVDGGYDTRRPISRRAPRDA